MLVTPRIVRQPISLGRLQMRDPCPSMLTTLGEGVLLCASLFSWCVRHFSLHQPPLPTIMPTRFAGLETRRRLVDGPQRSGRRQGPPDVCRHRPPTGLSAATSTQSALRAASARTRWVLTAASAIPVACWCCAGSVTTSSPKSKNLDYRAASGRSSRTTRRLPSPFARSIIWTGPIIADQSGRPTVDIGSFVTRDAFYLATHLSERGQGSYRLDAARSMPTAAALAFPDNVEIEALLTFAASKPGDEIVCNDTGARGSDHTHAALVYSPARLWVRSPRIRPAKCCHRCGTGTTSRNR